MTRVVQLHDVGRIPLPGDNVTIATRRLEPGSKIIDGERRFELDCTVLEGHRFAIQPVARGELLLSWGLPFGTATSNLDPGSYVCNPGMLAALKRRSIDFDLLAKPNFVDDFEPYRLDVRNFQSAEQVALHEHQRTFQGYRRLSTRGVGTRNCIVLLGTSSRSSSYVRQLAKRFDEIAGRFRNIDGIVHVAHTEGGGPRSNNLDYVLRVLSGFFVHPNVGAVLAVDSGDGALLTNPVLRHFMQVNGYPLQDVPHQFLSITGGFLSELDRGEAVVNAWLDAVDRCQRTQQSASGLNIALQCGGSDAFSGVSGNPLASWVTKEIIQYGGSAVIGETAELVGAEAYMLQKVKDLETARAFLSKIKNLKQWASWHGATAEGNVAGGNRFRGLYNIALKSIGAARKRHPDVRLDAVIDYAEPMDQPGFVFMDTPGNDLESIAGQVAAGSNVILFVTGNGSVTNFPFVPTIKIVTTTERYEFLSGEMDVNAGVYLDGTPLDELGRRTLELTLDVASGERSKGELAGHTQVQIWRDWQQRDARSLDSILGCPLPSGVGIPVRTAEAFSEGFPAIRTTVGVASEQVGLILPASLCSGQIARLAAERMNEKELGFGKNLSRFVSLVHTEGCATSGTGLDELLMRTLMGYATHPMVRCCLLLEHGCEKNHNDGLRRELKQLGFDPHSFGWASVQLDGGMEKVLNTIEQWFAEALSNVDPGEQKIVGLDRLSLGMLTSGALSPHASEGLTQLIGGIVASGGTVVVPEEDGLLASAAFAACVRDTNRSGPTLVYGGRISTPGLHIMQAPSEHWVEAQTGLGATGVHIMLAYVGDSPKQGHPMIPVIQVTSQVAVREGWKDDLDLVLDGDPAHWSQEMLRLLIETFSCEYSPRSFEQGNVDFQITRGSLGISL